MNAVAAWGAFLVVLLAGWSLGVFSLRAAGVRLPTGKGGFCFGMLVSAAVGLLFLSYFVFLSFRLGIYLGQGTAWIACGLAVLFGILGGKSFPRESSPEPLSLKSRTPLQRFALAGIVAACLCILIACVLIPLKSYDARMIWAFHAKLIYASGTHPAPELLREGFVIGHPQYPPLFPLAMALVAAIRGELYEPAMRMVAVLFYFAVLALLLFELPRHENRWGFLLVAVYALTP
ncbi:MAG: hypothetical protein AB1405_11395, partial [Bdellovibrionota bacterium]